MRIRLFAAAASLLLPVLVAPACAEDAFQPTVRSVTLCGMGPDGGSCAHFQGYVYVRGKGADPRPALSADRETSLGGDPSIGGHRLSIHFGADETR